MYNYISSFPNGKSRKNENRELKFLSGMGLISRVLDTLKIV